LCEMAGHYRFGALDCESPVTGAINLKPKL